MEFRKENSLVRVNFSGGILGLLAGNHLSWLEKVTLAQNEKRWNLEEVVPDNRNLIVWKLRSLLLVFTQGVRMLSTVYNMVFKRRVSPHLEGTRSGALGRCEPLLSAKKEPA